MSSTGSISVSGLLGGTAGQIDTTSLISQLMTAAALPQTQLKNQLTSVNSIGTAYQSINTKLTALQTAAQALTDPTAWTATAATSSSSSVVATSDGTAAMGDTLFSVTQLARAQVTTVMADSSNNVVSNPSGGITITVGTTSHTIGSLASGSATDVAAAINQAGIGVKASVVSTDQGTVLQLVSATTGTKAGFTLDSGFSAANTLVTAQDAQLSVGTGAGAYTVSSATNTFSNFIPGVTFSVSAPATDVTISVTSDQKSISDKVAALVTAAQGALGVIGSDTAQGAVLQGRSDVRNVSTAILSSVSAGAAGQSLKKYGIDIDATGTMTFDANAFASAYAADPAGTQTAIASSFAKALDTASTDAVAPVNGTITQALSSLTDQSTRLNTEIGDWTTKLSTIQDTLTAKYAAMETALAKLQSQQTYLTSMFNSMSGSSSSSSSSSN